MTTSTKKSVHVLVEKCTFSSNAQWSSKTLGLLFGDNLVTMGVQINPWEAM